ncbi:MAG: hypothetical protein ACE37H_07985 [Phycisphaeraceae bacterium]
MHGILDNRVPGKVTGVLRFHGMDEEVRMDLEGDFHRDIRGTRIHLYGSENDTPADAPRYMQGMATLQIGKVGDMTAGQQPVDYVDYPYIEWYSERNGRVVLELQHEQVVVEALPMIPQVG